jgi:glutaredoxin
MKVQYYTKEGCPLCDEGLAILCTFSGLEIECIDIEEDPDVYGAFAVRIPVIKRMDGDAELGWPFDREDVEKFIRG